jgi:uncharacterized protein YuzE
VSGDIGGWANDPQRISGSRFSAGETMKLHYYKETDSLYIDLMDVPSVESQEIKPGIVLDFDAAGRLVGIDIDRASEHASLESLQIDELPVRRVG